MSADARTLSADARPRKPVMTAIADARRYCADARPRKRGVATIADAIGMRRFAFWLDALRHRQGKSAHSPSGLVAPPRHERASSRHTKRHESSVPLILSDFRLGLHSNAYSNFNSHSNLYTCATTPQFDKGRASAPRSFRAISCRPLGPLSCLAQGDNPKDEAEPLPWPGRMPRATRRRIGFKMRSICRLRKFSWSRVSAVPSRVSANSASAPTTVHQEYGNATNEILRL